MGSPEVEIYKSVKRFSDFMKDTIVNVVVNKMQDMEGNFNQGEMTDMVHTIEATFEQCNMNGFREVESAVGSALKKTSKSKNARR
jgi:hypothetical protein